MNLLPPYKFTKATDNIKEQIELIEVLERKGFTYATTDGIYFDTSKCVDYGKLSSIDYLNVVPRITENPEKKHQTDFALWKFSSPKEKRQMEWSSPWGVGFPGWHIECSAMCMKYLGNSIDIHCGGEDLKSTHHPNEIAQSESATGQIFSRFWFHSSFLLIDGKKMSKSLGNAYNIDDIKQKGFDTMDLKYFYYTGHYRKQINLTNEALQFARNSLAGLRKIVEQGIDEKNVGSVNELKYQEFMDALSDDLNTSKALAVLWGIAKDTVLSNYEKSATLLACSEVLGLALGGDIDVEEVTDEIHELLAQRELAKRAKQWDRADMIRNEIRALGFEIIDGANGQILKKKI